jgi:cytoskeletal protein CcmA (bactofilin family)
MKEQGKETLVEHGTVFKGSFASDCPIVVRGRVEGEITGPSLVVSKTGSVSGIVKVKEIRSEGELAGEYDADTVYLSGAVKDKTVLRARSLEVKLAPERGRMQVVFGECELEVGDVPSKETAVTDAKNAFAEPAEPPAPTPALWDDIPKPSPMVNGDGDGEVKPARRGSTAPSSIPPAS